MISFFFEKNDLAQKDVLGWSMQYCPGKEQVSREEDDEEKNPTQESTVNLSSSSLLLL